MVGLLVNTARRLKVWQTLPKLPAAIQQAPQTWHTWLAVWDALAEASPDVTVEDFGTFYAQFRTLQRVGVPFDPDFVRYVENVAESLRGRDDDPDLDDHDHWLEPDQEHEQDIWSKSDWVTGGAK